MLYSDAAKSISAELMQASMDILNKDHITQKEAIHAALFCIASAQLMQVSLSLEQSLSGVLGTQPVLDAEALKAKS